MKRRYLVEEDSSEEPFINLTPLIDVVLVVLICFMLIAPLLQVDRIQLALSGDKCEKISSEHNRLSIAIHSNNTIWTNGRQINLKELEIILKTAIKMHPKDAPVLLCDKNASFGIYQEIKNLMENCGFQQMDVALKSK